MGTVAVMLQNITINITIDELKKIVIEQVRRTWNREVESVTFDTHTVSCGYGSNESSSKEFKGVTVKLVPPK